MRLEQEIWIHCTDTDKKVKGKVIRLFKGGLDVAIEGSIIKMHLKRNNIYVGSLHGLEFTFIDTDL